MAKDARIQAALSHWSGRLITNGVPLADFQDVTGAAERWEDWCSGWSARGAVHRELGQTALAEERWLSAGEHLTTAALCYHFGKFLFVEHPEQMRAAHEQAVACLKLALPHLCPPGERVAIPYEGTVLYGNLRRPAGVERPPVVIMVMGLDSAKEEMGTNERLFLERGLATLAFDGPGQGEAEYELPICPEYERPVSTVVDYLTSLDDLDSERIGLWGVSLGGYYASRAAAFERRIRACIALSGPFDWAECYLQLPPLTRTAFLHRARCKDDAEGREFATRMTLAGVAGRITCPLYIVAGKLDRVIPHQQCLRLAQEASGPVTLNLIEDGTHVANNRGYKYRPASADWTLRQLVGDSA